MCVNFDSLGIREGSRGAEAEQQRSSGSSDALKTVLIRFYSQNKSMDGETHTGERRHPDRSAHSPVQVEVEARLDLIN